MLILYLMNYVWIKKVYKLCFKKEEYLGYVISFDIILVGCD